MSLDAAKIKAFTFDVFGTLVDWRTSVIKEAEALGRAKAIGIDWAAFADDWRRGYRPAMERVRNGELGWTNFDALHRMRLDELLTRYGVCGLSETEKADFNRVWHRLDPWPDSAPGLERLRRRFVVATLSNGNVALLTHLSKHAGLDWDCILSAELARHYKPDREVYDTAAELLDLRPEEIVMAAAHRYDLCAAAEIGFRTAFIQRPLEFGPDNPPDIAPDPHFDCTVTGLEELAARLGA